MPGDITNWLEESAVQDTLVAPLHSAYEQEAEPEYDAEQPDTSEPERSDFFGAGQDQPAESPEATDELEATPEQRAEYQQEMQRWDALPDDQKSQLADQYLETEYDAAYSSITPQEATNFTNTVGANWGVENLANIVDPVPFAVFAESWGNNAERTIAHHPSGPEFLEALTDEQHPERALQLAASMCDPVMVQRFFSHFQNILGREHFARRDPMQFAAECMVDLGRLQGWGQRQQQEGEASVGGASPFKTNSDLFDNSTLDRFRRL